MTDRRAFLAAALAAPIVISSPAVAQTLSSKWDAAMRAYLDAKAMHEANYGDEPLCDAMIGAEDVLLAIPAPHLAAVEWKLLHWQSQTEHSQLTPKCFESVISDVRRLHVAWCAA